MVKTAKRLLLLLVGIIAFLFGLAGAVLPVIPGTPFFILAVFCFARSSNRLHRAVLSLPIIGAEMKRWERDGTLRPWVKCALILSLWVYFGIAYIFITSTPVRIALLFATCIASTWIIKRPSPNDQDARRNG